MMFCVRDLSLVSAAYLLAACSLAPDYKRPEMAIPESYKEEAGHWRTATPTDADSDKGAWWKAYGDDDLNALEDKIAPANQDLKAAVARYDQARAEAGIARADLFPTLQLTGGGARDRISKNTASPRPVSQYNDITAGAQLSYEFDIWGRARNAAAASESRAAASASDLAALDLSLHAELAMNYFSLRGEEAAQKIADEAVAAYQKALDLTQARHEGGASSASDVDQAETQLQNAKTIAADASLKRSQLEHAIAVLVGENPSGFSLAAKQSELPVPPIMPGIPSELLDQRPDIAASAKRVEAANADIGAARAAYLPDLTFSAAGGFESAVASKLFNAPSLFWSIGPSALFTVFDGGRISSLSDEARAAYDEAVANYRAAVLTAFEQVEDNLAALRQLAQENESGSAASAAAGRALMQAKNRYSGGIVTYLDVVVAQNLSLQADLSLADIQTRRLNASVQLIKALGGSWKQPEATPENTPASEPATPVLPSPLLLPPATSQAQ